MTEIKKSHNKNIHHTEYLEVKLKTICKTSKYPLEVQKERDGKIKMIFIFSNFSLLIHWLCVFCNILFVLDMFPPPFF